MEDKSAQCHPPPSTPAQRSDEYTILKEGDAEILLRGNDVFYNKAQIVNRDLSIAVLRTFVTKRKEEIINERNRKNRQVFNRQEPAGNADAAPPSLEIDGNAVDDQKSQHNTENGGKMTVKPICVLEALAASGLRALRYAKEIKEVGSVIALDNDQVAVDACKRNIKLNGSIASAKVHAVHSDARIYMLNHEKQFDAVDIDPYGSPSVFLDSAVQTVVDGGLIMCTATDMAVLCGNNGEVCYSKYGAYPLRGKYCHEMALRILLASIESHANRYKRFIVPVLSVSVDFYIRVFVRIYTSAKAVKETPSKLSYVYQCVGCDAFHLQPVGRTIHKNDVPRFLPGTGPVIFPECKHCGKRFNMGGPIWSEPIHDSDWISLVLQGLRSNRKGYPAFDKVHGFLTAISEELLDVPLYLSLHSLCSTLKCTSPSASLFRYAVANAGYRISGSHASPLGLKTDAPIDVVWDIMRCWVKTHPVKAQPADAAGSIILSKEPNLEANFSKVNSALSKAREKGVPRFVLNPEECWGPKPRAGRRITSKHIPSHGNMDLSVPREPMDVNDTIDSRKESDAENTPNVELKLDDENKFSTIIETEAINAEEPELKRQKVELNAEN